MKAHNFTKKRLQHRCFSVNIAKSLRTPILKKICGLVWQICQWMLERCYVESACLIRWWLTLSFFAVFFILTDRHCVKSVQIWRFFWSVFFCIRTEYVDLRIKCPYSVQIQENTDQKKLHIWTLSTPWEAVAKKFSVKELFQKIM